MSNLQFHILITTPFRLIEKDYMERDEEVKGYSYLA